MVCWGTAYVPSAWLAQSIGPFGAAAWRLGVAGGVLWVIAAARGHALPRGIRIELLIGLALAQTTVFYGATFWGIAHEGAGLASVLANSDPLFVAILAVGLLGEHLRPLQRVGLVVGFLGVAIAVCTEGLLPPHPTVAAIIVVIGAFAWAAGTIVAARAIRDHSHPWSLAAWQLMIGAVGLLLLMPFDHGAHVPTHPRDIGLVLLLGILGSAVPTALFYFALRTGAASEVSAWFFLVPILGVFTAWPLLGEQPTITLWIGLVGVSIGLWCVLRQRSRLVASRSVMSNRQPPELP